MLKRLLFTLMTLCMSASVIVPVNAEGTTSQFTICINANGGKFETEYGDAEELQIICSHAENAKDWTFHYLVWIPNESGGRTGKYIDYKNPRNPDLSVLFKGFSYTKDGDAAFATKDILLEEVKKNPDQFQGFGYYNPLYVRWEKRPEDPAHCTVMGFCPYNGKKYWFENGYRQGVYGDPLNITDLQYGVERGREIYDPKSDGWYWLDAVYEGAAAYSKEVWMPYVFQDEYEGKTDGKWVLYDENGKMVKGWYENQKGKYYYDLITGEMAKGNKTIDGQVYFFDPVTGICQGLAAKELDDNDWRIQLARQWSGNTEGTCEYWAGQYSKEIVGFTENSSSINVYEISREELRVGDLIGYHSKYSNVWHVCIYLGENRAFHGNYFVNGAAQTTIAPWRDNGTNMKFFRANHNSVSTNGWIFF